MAPTIAATRPDCCGEWMHVMRRNGHRYAQCASNGRHDGYICGACGNIADHYNDPEGVWLDCQTCGDGGYIT